MVPITGVYAGDKSAFSMHCPTQHARHRLRSVGLAKLIENARPWADAVAELVLMGGLHRKGRGVRLGLYYGKRLDGTCGLL